MAYGADSYLCVALADVLPCEKESGDGEEETDIFREEGNQSN